MTTPGSGDQPPQNPGQGWGQQPPSGPQGPGAPQPGPADQQWAPPGGQPQQPGQQFGQPGQQPYGQPGQQPYGQAGQQPYGQPGQQGPGQQPWGGQQFSGEAPKKERPAWQKRLPLVAGAIVVALVVALFRNGVFGGGAPEVGDCVQASGSDGYEVVDCDSSDAQFRIFGTDDDMTEVEFTTDPDTCLEAAQEAGATDGRALWYGETGETGQVFCAETIG